MRYILYIFTNVVFQVQSQCQLEDKRQLSAVLSETQRNLSEAERKNLSLENEMEELKKLREEEVRVHHLRFFMLMAIMNLK